MRHALQNNLKFTFNPNTQKLYFSCRHDLFDLQFFPLKFFAITDILVVKTFLVIFLTFYLFSIINKPLDNPMAI